MQKVMQFYPGTETKIWIRNSRLTISGHAHSDTFLKSAVLAAIAVDPHNVTLLIFEAGPILDLLLDATPEEALQYKGQGQGLLCWLSARQQCLQGNNNRDNTTIFQQDISLCNTIYIQEYLNLIISKKFKSNNLYKSQWNHLNHAS